MSKMGNFIKKIVSLLLISLIISTPQLTLARAGGGGSGGGSSSHHSGSIGGYGRRSDPFSSIISIGMFLCISSAGVIVYKVRISKKKIKSVSVIKELSKNDFNWDYNEMKKDIEEAFYKIQNAWTERNQDLAKEYMSEKLYIRHRTKTEWMKVRKEKNILKNVKLLKATPISVKDRNGLEEDAVWVHIRAKAKDYIINEESGDLISGNKYKTLPFDEYWKFIRNNKRWILDEIRQIDDVDNLDFFDINIEN